MILSPAQLGALRALGVVVLMAVLTWLGDTANLNGIVSTSVAAVISMIALGIEHTLASGTGTAMFGAVTLTK